MDDFDDDPRGSGGSIAAPLIRALLAAAVAFGVYWLVFAQGDPADEVVLEPTPTPVAAATVPPEPLPTPTTPVMVDTPPPTIAETEPPVGVGVSVQVLNGTDDQSLFESAIAALEALGYEVVPAGRAANDYSTTTVFPTAGQEAQAQALVDVDPRFAVVGDNPGNLTADLDIHVVVGSDWVVDDAAGETPGAATEAATEG